MHILLRVKPVGGGKYVIAIGGRDEARYLQRYGEVNGVTYSRANAHLFDSEEEATAFAKKMSEFPPAWLN